MFCTARHGFSLRSLYRRCRERELPALLIIRTSRNIALGAFLSHSPAVSDNFYGTGESWLFTFKQETLRIFPWTGENNYIMRAGPDTFIVGSSEGRFGLWLDESFNQGRSQNVSTFDNKPLAGKEDFIVNNIECWAFM